MIRRCCDSKHKDYKVYGLIGITVSKSWKDSFETFLSDMGERPKGLSLDRINVYGNYCKENCRWATNKEQGRNRRYNKILTINGISKTAKDWSEVEGAVKYSIILDRSKRGWSDEDSVFREPRRVRKTEK